MRNDDDSMYNEGRFPDVGDVMMPEWTADGHLEEGTIHAWLDGEYSAANSEVIEAHIQTCGACQALVAEARGLLAGASRITAMLDAVPAGVIPARTVPAVVPAVVPQVDHASSVRDHDGSTVRRVRPWYGQRFTRIAATVVVFVGGAAVWSTLPTPSVFENADSQKTVSAVTKEASERENIPAEKPAADGPSVATRALFDSLENAVPSVPRSIAAQAIPRRAPQIAPADVTPSKVAPVQLTEKASAKAASDIANVAMERREVASASPPPPDVADRMRVSNRAGMSVGATTSTANETVISGRVVDERGAGLSAVSVGERDGAKMVVTDSLGRFMLRTRLDSVDLVARRLGYTMEERRVAVSGRDSVTVNIPLTKDNRRLSTVAVTGTKAPFAQGGAAAASVSSVVLICLEYEPSSTERIQSRDAAPSSAVVPRFIAIARSSDASPLPSARISTTWYGALNSTRPVSVSMSVDSSGVMHGEQFVGRQHLRLSIREIGTAWTGTGLFTNGLSQVSVPARYIVRAPIMCKF